MARIRSVKPEIRRSLTVAEWPREVRLTWIYLWMYLDDDGVPLAPPIAVSGCPAVPTRGEAELYATRIVEVAGWVEAASVLLVWQNDDESLSASFDDQRWAQAILSCVDPGGLTIHPPMRRTPTDVSRLVLAG